MNLDAAPQRVNAVKGPRAAAKLYADIEYELAMGDPSPDQEQQGEAALQQLEQRFPGIKGQADDVVENGHVPNMSNRARGNALGPGSPRGGHDGRQRRGGHPAPSQHARRKVAANRRRRSTSGAGGGRTSFGAQAGQSLWTGTGLSFGADSISSMAMKGLGLIIGLSLLYLVVKPNGSRVFSTATTTGSNLLHAFISPNVDPLQRAASSKAAPAPAPIVGRSSSSLGTAQLMQASQALNQQARTPGNGVRPVPRAGLTLRPTTALTLPGH